MAVAITNTDSPISASALTTHTFTGASLGAAADDRIIAVVVSAYHSPGGGPTVSSLTIGGVSANFRLRAVGSTRVTVELWTLAVPLGTTANIVVQWSVDSVRCGAGVFRIVGSDGEAPSDTATNTGTGNLSTTIDVVDNGALLAGVGATRGASSFSTTFAGVTESYDEVISGGVCQSGGCADLSTGESGRTVSATFNVAPDFGAGLIVAAWSPPGGGQPLTKRLGGVPFVGNRGVW
jgi:hypothetical protein